MKVRRSTEARKRERERGAERGSCPFTLPFTFTLILLAGAVGCLPGQQQQGGPAQPSVGAATLHRMEFLDQQLKVLLDNTIQNKLNPTAARSLLSALEHQMNQLYSDRSLGILTPAERQQANRLRQSTQNLVCNTRAKLPPS